MGTNNICANTCRDRENEKNYTLTTIDDPKTLKIRKVTSGNYSLHHQEITYLPELNIDPKLTETYRTIEESNNTIEPRQAETNQNFKESNNTKQNLTEAEKIIKEPNNIEQNENDINQNIQEPNNLEQKEIDTNQNVQIQMSNNIEQNENDINQDVQESNNVEQNENNQDVQESNNLEQNQIDEQNHNVQESNNIEKNEIDTNQNIQESNNLEQKQIDINRDVHESNNLEQNQIDEQNENNQDVQESNNLEQKQIDEQNQNVQESNNLEQKQIDEQNQNVQESNNLEQKQIVEQNQNVQESNNLEPKIIEEPPDNLRSRRLAKSIQKSVSYILPESISKRENINNYYEISSTLLGIGGSSKIFLARNQKGENCAIKQVVKGGVAKPEELIREAKVSIELNHKNIVKCYEIYEDIYYIYFVLELGDGGDLFDFIKSGENMCLSPDMTIDLLIQILEAVDYLHSEKKIMHRDIKPENFLLKIDENNNPIIKLTDFGLAINIPEYGEKITEIIGTRKYASPEMLLGYGYNEKVDEWAIGVVLFSMLTGYEPFRRTGEHKVENSIVAAKIDFEIIEDPELRLLNQKLLDRFEISRITCKEALAYLKELKDIRDIVYNEDYYKDQRFLFVENYKFMRREKLNQNERNTL